MVLRIFSVAVIFFYQSFASAEIRFTCRTHGGVNCQGGKDSDGSVICYDGFKDSSQRYNFECTAARLQIDDTKIEGGFLKVFVRNESAVAAKGVTVAFTLNSKPVKLDGPSEIEGYEGGEYSVRRGPEAGQDKPLISVSCVNCPS